MLETLEGDEVEIHPVDDLVDQPFGGLFQPQRESECFILLFMILAVHGGYAGGYVPFVVDILPTFAVLGIQNDAFQNLHDPEDGFQGGASAAGVQLFFELFDQLEIDEIVLPDHGHNIVAVDGVFLPEKGRQAEEDSDPLPVIIGSGFKPGYIAVQLRRRQTQQRFIVRSAHRRQLLHDLMYRLEIRTLCIDGLDNVLRQIREKPGRVRALPVADYLLDQLDMGIVAFRMDLLA